MSQAVIFWFTGLSGSGKTTLAEGVRTRLQTQGKRILILDGDQVRDELHKNLGFTPEDIRENNRLIVELCTRHRADHDVILVPIISPFRDSREGARASLSPGFYEVYIAATLETVVERDVKGLYAKARDGAIDNMIGYSPGAVYEAPEAPDLSLDTGSQTFEDSLALLMRFIEARLETERAGT